jgi:hypothetical protein
VNIVGRSPRKFYYRDCETVDYRPILTKAVADTIGKSFLRINHKNNLIFTQKIYRMSKHKKEDAISSIDLAQSYA